MELLIPAATDQSETAQWLLWICQDTYCASPTSVFSSSAGTVALANMRESYKRDGHAAPLFCMSRQEPFPLASIIRLQAVFGVASLRSIVRQSEQAQLSTEAPASEDRLQMVGLFGKKLWNSR